MLPIEPAPAPSGASPAPDMSWPGVRSAAELAALYEDGWVLGPLPAGQAAAGPQPDDDLSPDNFVDASFADGGFAGDSLADGSLTEDGVTDAPPPPDSLPDRLGPQARPRISGGVGAGRTGGAGGAVEAALSPRMQRLIGWTPESKRMFLEALARSGNVKCAAAYVSMSREGAYQLRRRDRAFALAWEGALMQARELAEDELQDKAMNGFTEQLHYHGEVIDSRTRFDGRMLLALLGRLDKRAEGPLAALGAARFDDLLTRIGADEDASDLLIAPAADAGGPDAGAVGAGGDGAGTVGMGSGVPPEADDPHILWMNGDDWWTDYPPGPDHDGIEQGRYGDSDYRRMLDDDELAAIGAEDGAADDLALAEAQRRARFGLNADADAGAGADAEDAVAGDAGVAGTAEAVGARVGVQVGVGRASDPAPSSAETGAADSRQGSRQKASLDSVKRVKRTGKARARRTAAGPGVGTGAGAAGPEPRCPPTIPLP